MSQSNTDMYDTSNAYLICDLDGTLLKKDFFVSRLLFCLLTKPKTYIHATQGLVALKHFVLDKFSPDFDSAINNDVVELIKQCTPQFKKTLLISASTDQFVKRIADDIPIFNDSHGTTSVNLKGANKLDFIKQKGYEPFVYIGDSKADEILFKNALYYYKIINDNPVLFQ